MYHLPNTTSIFNNMKNIRFLTIALWIFLLIPLCSVNAQESNVDKLESNQGKMQWWKDAKFGMFMHWGLYSKTAGMWQGRKYKGAEHFMLYERIPWKVYATIADDFNPVEFDADKWIKTARDAGMQYFVITTKHHDGFAMYDSPSSDYDIVDRTPFGKDPMKALARACRKYGIKLGFYYSLGRDWQDPDAPTNWPTKAGRSNTWDYPDEDAKVFNRYFERKVKPQIKEIMTQYAPVDILWFDTPGMISKSESQELRDYVLGFNPDCIINSRIGHNLGDYLVLEQNISKENISKPWESCITMGRNWGYIKYDTVYKSPEVLVRQLLDITSKGGNYLLNNGPRPDGKMTEKAVENLRIVGKWMDKNAEGIYGTSPWVQTSEIPKPEEAPKDSNMEVEKNTMKDAENDATSKAVFPQVFFTQKEGVLYAFVSSWDDQTALIKSLGTDRSKQILKVELLGASRAVEWKQTSKGLIVELPKYKKNEVPVSGFKIQF